MDPQQELFTALLIAAREQGYDVYDGRCRRRTRHTPLSIWQTAVRQTLRQKTL